MPFRIKLKRLCKNSYDSQVDETKSINRRLPVDCLLKVMDCLNIENRIKCRSVCKFWCDELVPSLLKPVQQLHAHQVGSNRFVKRYMKTPQGLTNILAFCPQIQVLDLYYMGHFIFDKDSHLSDALITALKTNKKQLKVLRLPIDFLDADQFRELVLHLTADLEELEAVMNGVTDESLIILMENCPNLRILKIESNAELSASAFRQLPLRNLQRLEVIGCGNVQLYQLIHHLQGVKDKLFYLTAYDDVMGSESRRRAFENIAQFSNLEHLELCENNGRLPRYRRDISYLAPLKSLHKLRELTIRNSMCIQYEDISALVGGCTLLEKLDIHHSYGGTSLSAAALILLKNAQNLVELDISGHINVCEQVVEGLCRLPKLKVLELRACRLTVNALRLLSGCTQLTKLNLSNTKHLTFEDSLLVLKELVHAQWEAPRLALDMVPSCFSDAYGNLSEDKKKQYKSTRVSAFI